MYAPFGSTAVTVPVAPETRPVTVFPPEHVPERAVRSRLSLCTTVTVNVVVGGFLKATE